MLIYSLIDSTSNLMMIENLVLGETWTGDLPILSPESRRANLCAIKSS